MRIAVIIVFFVSLVTASAQVVDILEFRKVDYFEVVSNDLPPRVVPPTKLDPGPFKVPSKGLEPEFGIWGI